MMNELSLYKAVALLGLMQKVDDETLLKNDDLDALLAKRANAIANAMVATTVRKK